MSIKKSPQMQWLLARLREPSSYNAIAIGLASVGYVMPPDLLQGMSLLGAGIATVIAFVLPESPRNDGP